MGMSKTPPSTIVIWVLVAALSFEVVHVVPSSLQSAHPLDAVECSVSGSLG